MCGGFEFDTEIGRVGVPSWCFKIVKNLDTKEVKAYIFPNDDSDTSTEIYVQDLFKKIENSGELHLEKLKELTGEINELDNI